MTRFLCACFCIGLLLPLLAVLQVKYNIAASTTTTTTTTTDTWREQGSSTLSRLRPPRFKPNQQDAAPPDGFFNGFPLHVQQDPALTDEEVTTHSSVHCVGDNYQDDAWLQQSCSFAMLCYDHTEQDFVIFQSHNDKVLEKFLQARPATKVASTMRRNENETIGVALGGLNLKWSLSTTGKPTSKSFKWFPRILNATAGITYYALPSNTVMVPYHSMAAKNPGHLVWDDFLPIYTLLTMFQLQNYVLLPLRMTLGAKLFGSCENSEENEHSCQKMTQKFLPLLVGPDYPYNLTRWDNVQFTTKTASPVSRYVCAPRAAAGLSALTDHGTKKFHGWMRDDYKITQNHGRGALLYEFRNFMLDNLGLSAPSNALPVTTSDFQPPYKVVFSVASSDIVTRNMDFSKQIQTLEASFPSELIVVESYVMKDLSVREQVKIASEAAVFVTICGGGAVTGMFLPKGAAVILYYLEHGGVEFGVMTGKPAHLDWDLFNNLAHLRTHWLPTQTMDQRVDLRTLVLLVRQEVEFIQGGVLI